MPPRAKITKDMVIDAAYEIAREDGWENISARTVSQALKCSTQPVMYHFSTIDELKQTVYDKVDEYHSEFLMKFDSDENILLQIGRNYIRFAVEEPNFFKFLFQSGFVRGNSFFDLVDAEELQPLLMYMQQETKTDIKHTKEIFLTVWLFSHGYASIIANNSLEYDEAVVLSQLESAFTGAMRGVQEDKS